MDVEKTIQAILESQLRAEKRADRADERMDKFDKQLRATENLVRAGMKIIIERDKKFDFKLNALIDAQNRSEDKFNRWMDELRKKRTNGHS